MKQVYMDMMIGMKEVEGTLSGTGRFFGDIENMSPIFTRYGFTVKEVSGCVCTYDVR